MVAECGTRCSARGARPRTRARQAAARGRRGFSDRLRGRVRQSTRRRRGRSRRRRGARSSRAGCSENTLSPFIGMRIKPLNEELRARSIRTLDIVLTTLVSERAGFPSASSSRFPKITIIEQVTAFVAVLEQLEREARARRRRRSGSRRWSRRRSSSSTPSGRRCCRRSRRRATATRRRALRHVRLHGVGCNITAAYQRMRHPACDFAKHVMQVAFAGTGVWLSDGSTTVMPVPIHRGRGRPALTDDAAGGEPRERASRVADALRRRAPLAGRRLLPGLGSASGAARDALCGASIQLLPRRASTPPGARLRNFVGKAAQATLVGDVFDDAATGQGCSTSSCAAINSGRDHRRRGGAR